jgi:hypothetical protein
MLRSLSNFSKYKISEDGEVFQEGSITPRKIFKNEDGYKCIVLIDDNGDRKHKRICRLVAECYVPNPDSKPVVNHKNLVRDNDNYLNLEWVTIGENNRHGICNNIDSHRSHAKVTKAQVITICELIQAGLRAVDIQELTGVSKDSIDHISKGASWSDISCEYKFPRKGSRVSVVTALWVKNKLNLGWEYKDILKQSTNNRLSLLMIELIHKNLIYKELD